MTTQLFNGERQVDLGGLPVLYYSHPGDQEKPLAIFLTGGGFLARISYGHPGADPRDFLAYWLGVEGYGLLAPSYPCDHAVFDRFDPELELGDWANSIGDLVDIVLADQPGNRPIVLLGWSMGGKLAFCLTKVLRSRGRNVHCFVSISATPPFPAFSGRPPAVERFHENGLWDIAHAPGKEPARDERWLSELDAISQTVGRTVISSDALATHYRVNAPAKLWGPELDSIFRDYQSNTLGESLREASTFSFSDYPICAAIIPTHRADFRHALLDEPFWTFASVQSILHVRLADKLTYGDCGNAWEALQELFAGLSRRLNRRKSGGHMAFLGEECAQQTVQYIAELVREVEMLDESLFSLGY